MSKIGITLNEVLRDFINRFEYIYGKYIDDSIDIEKNPVNSFDLIKYFSFENTEAMNKFLYQDAALEIFGHADELYDNLIVRLNSFILDMKDLYGHDIQIISREASTSIPATFWFLSKTLCKCNNIKFVSNYEDKWDDVDILITANPIALDCKPIDKISVKVNTTYNTDVKSDYTIESLFDFMNNDTLRNNVINNVNKNS
jgi:hypothetical protein